MIKRLVAGKTYVCRDAEAFCGFQDLYKFGFVLNKPNKLLIIKDEKDRFGVGFEHQTKNNGFLEGYNFWYILSNTKDFFYEVLEEYNPYVQEEMEL